MIKRDTPGFAIGGLSGGESKHDFWKVRKGGEGWGGKKKKDKKWRDLFD